MKKFYLFIFIIFFTVKSYGYPLVIDFNSISCSTYLEKYLEEKPFLGSLERMGLIKFNRDYFYPLKKEPLNFYTKAFSYQPKKNRTYYQLPFYVKNIKEYILKINSGLFYYKRWKIDSNFRSDFSLYYLLNKKWSTALTYLNLTKQNTFMTKYKEEAEKPSLFLKIPANGLDWGLYLTGQSLFFGMFAGLNIGLSCEIETIQQMISLKFEYHAIPYGGIRATFSF